MNGLRKVKEDQLDAEEGLIHGEAEPEQSLGHFQPSLGLHSQDRTCPHPHLYQHGARSLTNPSAEKAVGKEVPGVAFPTCIGLKAGSQQKTSGQRRGDICRRWVGLGTKRDLRGAQPSHLCAGCQIKS